jgi:hypothetical protein
MPFYGVSIRGLGINSPDPSDIDDYNPTLWVRLSTVDTLLPTVGPKTTAYVDALCADKSVGELLGQIMSLRVEVLEGTGEHGTAEFDIQIDEHLGACVWASAAPPLQEASRFLTASDPRPWGRLMFDLSVGGKMADIDVPVTDTVEDVYFRKYAGSTDLEVGQLIYIGREVLQVMEYANPITVGDYIATQPTSVNQKLGKMSVRRGQCGSRQQAHTMGPLDDVEIFTENPVIMSRDVEVYMLSDSMESETLIFVGQLERPSAGSKFGSIRLRAVGEFSQLQDRPMGQEHAWWSWDLAAKDASTGELAPIHARPTRIVPLPGETLGGAGAAMVVVRGAAVQPIGLRLTPDRSGGFYRYQVAGVRGSLLGSSEDRKSDSDSEVSQGMAECLINIPGYSHFAFYDGEDYYHYTHPFDVLLCIMTSKEGDLKNGFHDTLPHGWGAGFEQSRFNKDSFEELKSPSSGFWFFADLSLDSLLIESRKSRFRDVIDRLLKPLLVFLTVDNDHLITLKPFIDRGPNFIDATITDDDISDEGQVEQEMVTFDPRVDVRYKLARRGAGNEYSGELLGSSLRGVIGKRFVAFATDEEVDCMDYGDPQATSSTWLDDPGIRGLQALVTLRWKLANSALHTYKIPIQGSDQLIRPGMVVNVTSPALFNPRTGRDGVVNARCICVGATIEDETLRQTVELVNLGVTFDSAQVLAPSWYIESVTSGSSMSLADDFEEQEGMWAFIPLGPGLIPEDVWVTVYHPDTLGSLSGTYGVRRMYSAGVGGAVVIAGGGFLASPPVGHIIGLANWSSHAYDANKANGLYTHLCDDDGKLYDLTPSESEGHKWGF